MSPSTAAASDGKASAYIQRLDLGADPFSKNFDGEYFYDGALRRDVLDQLVHFSRFSDQVVVLTGSTGSGTSSLLDKMFDQLNQIMDYCDINGENVSTPEKILESLAEQLQLQLTPPYQIDEFISVFCENAYIGIDSEPLLVAIDQAHYLSIESFGLLLNLLEKSQRRIRLLLVGEYQIEQLSNLAGFTRDKLNVLELEALTPTETGEFVLGMLCSVGYAGDQPLSNDQLAILCERSGGNIAEIIRFTPALLETDSADERKPFVFRIPIVHLSAIVILIFTLGLSYWYLGSGDQEPPGSSIKNKSAPPMVIREEFAKEADNKTVGSPGKIAIPPTDKSSSRSSEVGDSPRAVKSSGNIEPMPSVSAADESSKSTEQNKENEEVLGYEREAEKVISDEKKTAEIQGSMAAENLKGSSSTTEVLNQIELEKTVIGDSTPKKSGGNTGKITVVSTVSEYGQRLLEMPSTAYLLQLTGTVDEERIKKFLKQYSGRVSINYFETRLKNKPWFVAVTGPFDNRKLAIEAIERLPAGLKKQKPWARSVSGVQSDIRSR